MSGTQIARFLRNSSGPRFGRSSHEPRVDLPAGGRPGFHGGIHFYEKLSPGRGGTRFESAFRSALRQIEGGLVTHTPAFEHFHRVFVPRFPYNVYYRLINERAVIVGVLYARFDPKKIERQLKQRVE